MIPRIIAAKVGSLSRKFPVIALTGPRQSGKTTLARKLFPRKPYVTLENPDTMDMATGDPRYFLEKYPNGAVFDEVQRAPRLFSYIQGLVDERRKNGMYVLTGSQQFELMSNITQSLSGRVAMLTLLPFAHAEIAKTKFKAASVEECLYRGGYPRLYDQEIEPEDWFANYIRTYVERDVRLMKNIDDLSSFQRFIKMCAARTGQILNLSSLGNDCGISHNTAKAWISILEASYVVFMLEPHHKNFNKRLIKAPKLYFWDSGLVCHLLGIRSPAELETHSKRGEIFETWIVSELMKQFFNAGKIPALYFWHDQRHEIDVLYAKGDALTPIEIKSAKTIHPDHFKNLIYWRQIAKTQPQNAHLIYAGNEKFRRSEAFVYPWRKLPNLVKI